MRATVPRFGHRGVMRWENTRRGIVAALDAGLDGVEVDLQLSADGKVVVFHDRTLARLAGEPGKVAEMTWAELQAVELLGGEKVLGLEELLDLVPEDKWLNLEFKAGGAAVVEAVLPVVEGRDQVVYSSFGPQMLEVVAREGTRHEVATLLEDGSPGWLWASGGKELGAAAVHVDAALCSVWLMERYAAMGMKVGIWGATSVEMEARLVARGAIRVITDFV